MLAQADPQSAEAKAESLARLISHETVQAGDWLAPIRVSWGVRQIDPSLDVEALLADADTAMFAMKRDRE